MRVPIGYKFILGFLVVVAAVAFASDLVGLLHYSPEMTVVLSYVVAMTLGLILGWLFSRRFSRDIGKLTSAAEAISQGDLTREAHIKGSRLPDETHDMAVAINRMGESLRQLVRHIMETAERVSDSAGTLSSSAQELRWRCVMEFSQFGNASDSSSLGGD